MSRKRKVFFITRTRNKKIEPQVLFYEYAEGKESKETALNMPSSILLLLELLLLTIMFLLHMIMTTTAIMRAIINLQNNAITITTTIQTQT